MQGSAARRLFGRGTALALLIIACPSLAADFAGREALRQRLLPEVYP